MMDRTTTVPPRAPTMTGAPTITLGGLPGEMIGWPAARDAYIRALEALPTDAPTGFTIRVGGQEQFERAEVRAWIERAIAAKREREAADSEPKAQAPRPVGIEAARAAFANDPHNKAMKERIALSKQLEAEAIERERLEAERHPASGAILPGSL